MTRADALCSSCKAPITWMKTAAGRNMPVDRASVADTDGVLFDSSRGHIAHFATCPNAPKHRKARS